MASESQVRSHPTALEVVESEGLIGNLQDKVIVITGARSGIGLETARALSATGATLLLTVRDAVKAQSSLSEILKPGRVSLIEMDNGSLTSVRAAAQNILARTNGQVNLLICNAGMMGVEQIELTEDGHETTFGVNHLSHFLLFQLLKPALLASSTPEYHSRVVMVSSSGHRGAELPASDNYSCQKGGYNSGAAYGHSKLANIYMANELERRYGGGGLHATSLHPGGINTSLYRNLPKEIMDQIMSNEAVVKSMKSPEEGAATTVVAAVGKEWGNRGGRYLEDCKEALRGPDDGNLFGPGYVRQTYHPQDEKRLWRDSLSLLGLEDDSEKV